MGEGGSGGACLCSRLYVWHCPPGLCFSDLCWVCSPLLFLFLFFMPAPQPLSFSSLLFILHTLARPLSPKTTMCPHGSPGTARCGSRRAVPRPTWFLWRSSGCLRPLRNTLLEGSSSVRGRSPLLGPQFAQSPRRAHRADLLLPAPPLPPEWALPRVNPGKRLIKPGSRQPPAGGRSVSPECPQ